MDRRDDRRDSGDELLTAYLRHAAASSSGESNDASFWAWEAVDDLTRHDPEALWAFLCVAIRRAGDDATLAYIAAGPLEDLMARHGEQFIDRIESEARCEAKVRRALCGVWGRGRMAPAVAERLDRLVANQPPL